MFNFLKKNDDGGRATYLKSTDLNTIVDRYVEKAEAVEPEISEDEQIASNEKVIDFLEQEKSEASFQNEKSVFELEIQERHDQNKVLAMTKEQRKLDGVFAKIDLSFLSMKKKNPKDKDGSNFKIAPKLPAFSCHQLFVSEDKMCFEECQISIEARESYDKDIIIMELKAWGSHSIILEHIKKAFSYTTDKTSYKLTHRTQSHFAGGGTYYDYKIGFRNEFKGMIPRQTKQKLKNAIPMFAGKESSNIFLIKECESWEQSTVTKDPLIIGFIGDQAYLIDHFDCTDMEAYVRQEFTS